MHGVSSNMYDFCPFSSVVWSFLCTPRASKTDPDFFTRVNVPVAAGLGSAPLPPTAHIRSLSDPPPSRLPASSLGASPPTSLHLQGRISLPLPLPSIHGAAPFATRHTCRTANCFRYRRSPCPAKNAAVACRFVLPPGSTSARFACCSSVEMDSTTACTLPYAAARHGLS